MAKQRGKHMFEAQNRLPISLRILQALCVLTRSRVRCSAFGSGEACGGEPGDHAEPPAVEVGAESESGTVGPAPWQLRSFEASKCLPGLYEVSECWMCLQLFFALLFSVIGMCFQTFKAARMTSEHPMLSRQQHTPCVLHWYLMCASCLQVTTGVAPVKGMPHISSQGTNMIQYEFLSKKSSHACRKSHRLYQHHVIRRR